MTLQKKTLGIVGLTFMVAIGLLAYLSHEIVLKGFLKQETKEVGQAVERVQSALDNNLQALEGTTSDWAIWDDTYAYVYDHNQNYYETNLADDTPMVSLHLDLMMYVDSQGRTVFAKAINSDTGTKTTVPSSLAKHIYPGSPLLDHPDMNSGIKGILSLPEGLMLIASEPILQKGGKGPVGGTLIFGRFIDEDVIEELSRTTLVGVEFQALDDPKTVMPADFKQALIGLTEGSHLTVQPLDSNSVAGYELLNDVYGKPTMMLRIETDRDIFAQGEQVIQYYVLALVVVGALCLLVITLLLDRLVLRRLARLKSEVVGIGTMSDASARLKVAGQDELSTLAESINGMLSALQLSRQEQKEGEERFVKAFNATPAIEAIVTLQDWRFIDVNEAFVQLLGYSQEELIGRSALEVHLLDALAESRAGTADRGEVATTESLPGQTRVRNVEIKVRNKSGEVMTLLYSTEYVEIGGEACCLFAAIDITERKYAEELRFSKVFNSSPSMQVLSSMIDNRIIAVNAAFVRQFGYSEEEVVGRTSRELGLWPDDARRGTLAQLLGEQGHVSNMEITARTKSGEFMTILYSAEQLYIDSEPCVLSAALDITDRKLAEQRNQRQLGRLGALRTIDLAITSSLDLRLTLNLFIDQVITHLNVDAASLLLLNRQTQMLEHCVGRGFNTGVIDGAQVRLGQGFAGKVALERRTVGIGTIGKVDDAAFEALLTGEMFVAYYAVPLITKGQVKGVLEVFHRSGLEPDREWLDFLEALAGQGAIAIDNASLFNDLQRSNTELSLAYDTTLEGWSHALDLRDKETEGHTQRVTEMTVRLARYMGIDEESLMHIRRGALLHDIGKMGIPDAILLKPGPLTDEEWVVMRRHPQYAYKLLSSITFLRQALDIPHYHHEKWDGSGYPMGLKGEQIPLAARIFAIVDVWDALRSDRPYRAAWSEERVREHIGSLLGTHFDPKVVEAFLNMRIQAEALRSGPITGALLSRLIEPVTAG
jgi:PAS domain S-box-containing protein